MAAEGHSRATYREKIQNIHEQFTSFPIVFELTRTEGEYILGRSKEYWPETGPGLSVRSDVKTTEEKKSLWFVIIKPCSRTLNPWYCFASDAPVVWQVPRFVQSRAWQKDRDRQEGCSTLCILLLRHILKSWEGSRTTVSDGQNIDKHKDKEYRAETKDSGK